MVQSRHMLLVYAVALALVVGSGCGEDSTPTAPLFPSRTVEASIDPLCFATEAYALEHIVAVIGQDVVPTGFDVINNGGCQFGSSVTQISVTLTGEGGRQVVVIPLTIPAKDIEFPLPSTLDVPVIDPALPPGRYERTVTAGAPVLSGPTAPVSGFEPVLLVDDLDSTMTLLLRAGSRWERSGISNYTYRAAWQCFCSQEYVGEVDVSVLNDQVAGTEFVETSFTGEVPDPQRFGTVTDLFMFIEEALEQGAVSVNVEFHPEFGYPTEVFVDYDDRIADEEQGFVISTLAPG